MAQFRNCADIFDEILQKSGEPTNGNSPYEDQVKTYANKVHHAIIGGGSIFSREVDEDWRWARSKHPLVLELLAPYTTGTVTVTNGDVNITFSNAASVSLDGWYFQLIGYPTVYRITQNTSGVASAVIDSPMLESSGAYNFRCFKLDYEISPSYLYVDNFNDRLEFQETSGTTLVASLDHGSYTPSGLISHVISKLNGAGASVYTGSYDEVLKTFTITSDGNGGGGIFSMLGVTGSLFKRSALPLLGFDQIDYTGALTYTSAYIINGISRMVAPFEVYTTEAEQPFIKSLDEEELEEQYPIAVCNEVRPTHFAQIGETNDGAIRVRFNSYPKEATKVILNWVPMPIDLQDNVASFPLLPRKDIDTLIHGASAFILFDKEDSKWKEMYGLCKGGLEAMEKKNRSELFRTNKEFAQIIPRADLMNRERKFQYGYTVQGSRTPASSAETTQQMINTTLTYADFQGAVTSKTVTARTLPANRSLFAIIIKHSIAFAGGSISALTADVGISTDTDKFILGFDLLQAVAAGAQESTLTLFYPAAATDITVTLNATGDNLSALTQGSLTVYSQETIVSS